ncbi:MAG: hypothetical protein AB1632_08640, partial [Nitrospirota bacterium]
AECLEAIFKKKERSLNKRGDIRIWVALRKSIVGHYGKSFSSPHPNDKYISLWNRFLCEATYIISYRFLREATGREIFRPGGALEN